MKRQKPIRPERALRFGFAVSKAEADRIRKAAIREDVPAGQKARQLMLRWATDVLGDAHG